MYEIFENVFMKYFPPQKKINIFYLVRSNEIFLEYFNICMQNK